MNACNNFIASFAKFTNTLYTYEILKVVLALMGTMCKLGRSFAELIVDLRRGYLAEMMIAWQKVMNLATNDLIC